MRFRSLAAISLASVSGAIAPVQAQAHLNPLVDLLQARKPVFGLYAPANPRAGRGGRGGPPGAPGAAGAAAQPPAPSPAVTPAPPQKTPAELGRDAIMQSPNDYIFDGSMEGVANFDRSIESFGAFLAGYAAAGSPAERWKHPIVVKMHEIAPDPAKAAANIGRQLNLGVSTVVFVGVESAEEVKTGISAMRFKSKGGTRPDAVGGAPAFWGVSEKEYKEKADVWPLNPRGELLNWTIVESKAGVDNILAIAAVPGIGVLFPGAGTMRGVYSSPPDSAGRRVPDPVAWEAALQKVLDACNEFKIPCGFPANDPATMEMRYKQGFRVFVIGWGENGFKTVEAGVALRRRAFATAPALAQGARRPARQLVLDTAVADRVIRARRQSSNEAIARHDTAGIGAILAEDVVVVTSNSVKQVGRAASLARFADQFRTRPDVVYRRTPDAVTVFAAWEMASERGRWTGSWTDVDGVVSLGGSYFAKWRVINGAWLVESETYVPERCTGGTYCTTKP